MAVLRQSAVRYLLLAPQPAELPGVDKDTRGMHRAVRAAAAAAVAFHLAPGGAYELESHFAAEAPALGHSASRPGSFTQRDSARCHFKLPRALEAWTRRNDDPEVE